MDGTRVNADAAESLRQIGVPVVSDVPNNGYVAPVWGVQLWSIKERAERGAGFGWGSAASAVADHLRGLGEDPEAAREFLDAVLAVQAMGGDAAVTAMCKRGSGTPQGYARRVSLEVRPGVIVRCVPEGRGNGFGRRTRDDGKIRVRAVSAGYDPDYNVTFPRDVREPGGFFVVPKLNVAGKGTAHFYRPEGAIRPLLENA